jgi:predicted Kef-type K+ transport protein
MNQNMEPTNPSPENSDKSASSSLTAGQGLGIGCLANFLLLVLSVTVLFRPLSRTRESVEFVALMLLVLVVNAVVIFAAHRRGNKGLATGFVIAAAVAILIAGICRTR